MTKAQRAAYGAGSMTEKAPGLWRLQQWANGPTVERTVRGTGSVAREQLRAIADQPGPLEASEAPPVVADARRTFDAPLDEWMTVGEWRGQAPKDLVENRLAIENRIRRRSGGQPTTRRS